MCYASDNHNDTCHIAKRVLDENLNQEAIIDKKCFVFFFIKLLQIL